MFACSMFYASSVDWVLACFVIPPTVAGILVQHAIRREIVARKTLAGAVDARFLLREARFVYATVSTVLLLSTIAILVHVVVEAPRLSSILGFAYEFCLLGFLLLLAAATRHELKKAVGEYFAQLEEPVPGTDSSKLTLLPYRRLAALCLAVGIVVLLESEYSYLNQRLEGRGMDCSLVREPPGGWAPIEDLWARLGWRAHEIFGNDD